MTVCIYQNNFYFQKKNLIIVVIGTTIKGSYITMQFGLRDDDRTALEKGEMEFGFMRRLLQ